MSLPPSIAAALAEQHRRELLNQAETYRLTRAARSNRPARAHHAPRLMKTVHLNAATVTLVIIALALTAFLALGVPWAGHAAATTTPLAGLWNGGGSV